MSDRSLIKKYLEIRDNPTAVFNFLQNLEAEKEGLKEALLNSTEFFIERIDALTGHVETFKQILSKPLPKGEDGKTPTPEELIPLIQGLIPPPIPGEDYVLTEEDKKAIAKSIIVPIVEKVIVEKKETIREIPLITEVTKKEIVQVAKTDTPLQIAKKLNTLEEEVNMSVVRGLKKKFETILNSIRESKRGGGGGGGMGNVQHETFDISSASTSITTNYPIAGNGTAIFIFAYNGQKLDKDVHYTVGGNKRTLTFSAAVQTQLLDDTKASITYARG